jgi:hypothetical protein
MSKTEQTRCPKQIATHFKAALEVSMAKTIFDMYQELNDSKTARIKFMADAVRFLEDRGITVDDAALQNACMASEAQVAQSVKSLLDKRNNNVVINGVYVL